jgi:hypothetical protein
MSGGFATDAGDGRDVRAGRDEVAFEGTPGLRAKFEPTLEYPGFHCGDCAFIIGDAVDELENVKPKFLAEDWP